VNNVNSFVAINGSLQSVFYRTNYGCFVWSGRTVQEKYV